MTVDQNQDQKPELSKTGDPTCSETSSSCNYHLAGDTEPAKADESAASAKETSFDDDASFAEMLAAQEQEPAVRLESGQRVKATIVAITADTVFVSTGSKVDGLVDKAELEQDGTHEYAVGDVLDLYVVHVSPHEVRLSKVVRGSGGLAAIEAAKEAGIPVEGKVTASVKGGFSVDVMKRRAFCPSSQIDTRPVENPESMVGKTLSFLVSRVEKNGRNIVLSRRALIESQQSEGRDTFLAGIKEGDVLEAKVTRLAPFGIFVELAPGVEGMVHVSELSWSRVQQPDEVVSVDDMIRVKLLAITDSEKGKRISLSIRQVSEDPWKDAEGRLHDGDIVNGKVIRIAPFGAFVEVLPGIEGLIHISELSYEKRVHKVEEVLTVADNISVKVKEFDIAKKRLSLSLRDVAGDPWQDVEEQFPIGMEIQAKMEHRAPFGLFITIAPGVTALLPNSSLPPARARSKFDKLAPGEEIAVRIGEVNAKERRISLTLTETEQAELETEMRNNPELAKPAAGTGEGRPGRDSRPQRDFKDSKDKRGQDRPSRSNEEKDWKKHVAPVISGFGNLGSALQEAMQKKQK